MRLAKANREALRLQNRLRLGQMELPVRAELGRAQRSLGEVRRLQVGDVIQVPTRRDAPVVVFVGEQPKYLAWPFASKGEFRLKIAGEIPRGQEGRYR